MTVYVAMDSRVENVPAWLTEYTLTELTAINSKDVVFKFYAKDINAGDTVFLGENGQVSGCVNYAVFAEEASSDSIAGDVNADGAATILDLIMLQKYLLGTEDLTSSDAADLSKDGRIDVFDLCIMKRVLLSIR